MSDPNYKVMIRSLKKKLKGHYGEIASRSGVTIATVSRVLDGQWENDHVVNVAIEVRDELTLKEQNRMLKLSKAIG